MIFMFLRGDTDPKKYKRMTKITWYSEGGVSMFQGFQLLNGGLPTTISTNLPELIIRGGLLAMIWETMPPHAWLIIW